MTRGIMRAALTFVGALTGLVLSIVLSAPHGAEHGCPAFSRPRECSYPPNLTLWRIEWIGGGLVAGLVIGVVAVWVIGDRLRPDERSPLHHRH